VVSESTLASRINAARRALNDSGDEQRLICTIARKGVRFVGAVEGADRPSEASASLPIWDVDHTVRTSLLLSDRPPSRCFPSPI
jgi:DNA-binding winged helix-turn-helix (wHTH) protein